MSDIDEAREINNFLKGIAKVPLRDTEPIFRLVWSEDQFELRRGTFNEFYGKIFLREVTGVRQVRKYNYIHEKWVLEQWYPPQFCNQEELPESRRGSYEPIYVFQDKRGNALPVKKAVIEYIIHTRFQPKESDLHRKTRYQAEDEAISAADSAYYEDALEVNGSVTDLLLHHGEGIAMPKQYHIDSPVLRKQ